MIYKGYEAVIGLEVHVELGTNSKMFCSCSTRFGAEENTQCCPVCMGMPGTLPTVNRHAVALSVTAGLVCNCSIREISYFDRKNYFYPDLPKAYQISQFDMPLCEGGWIEIETGDTKKRIGITRIHMEEDAGKLIHDGERTYIDFNRCGVPLVEIVSEPDISSADEAVAYLRRLRSDLVYSGVSSCKMNEGKLRCDVNLSVRRVGDTALGVRTEMKNLNSFSSVARAIELEFHRQVDEIEHGCVICQQTLRYDEDSDSICFMRTKENAYGYRYFREPDLDAVVISNEYIEDIRAAVPMLAAERMQKYIEEYSLTSEAARVLTETRECAEYFEEAAELSVSPLYTANLIIGEYLRLTDAETIRDGISPECLAEISDMAVCGYINASNAKKLVKLLLCTGESAREYVDKNDMRQIRDEAMILELVSCAIENDPKSVSDYKKGKVSAKKALSGAIMRQCKGNADPIMLEQILTRELERV